ncbi:MAG: sterol desaturase family protein [Alphaproteobacteria bacterium]|nr:sterol desaturase family protein [Alphaproteobacteria bacterium]
MLLLGGLSIDVDAILTTLATKPSETFSIAALLVSLVIAGVFLSHVYRRRTGKFPALSKLISMLFPARLVRHKTHLIDFSMFFVNQSIIVLLFAWMVVSIHFINVSANELLVTVLGPATPTTLDTWVVMTIMTIAIYLAYEFSYWLDHYLSHVIPFLWEFHRVHHEAEVLSPLTNARVHPIDQVVFTNVTAVITGSVNGVLTYAFGQDVGMYTLYGLNIILFVFVLLVIQLQHTHVWIPFTGLLGRVLMSPAHHQIHHSTNPEHFNSNLGSSLCIFDWAFGTLHVPSKEREKLTFGVEQEHAEDDPQTLEHALLQPFVRAYRHLRPKSGGVLQHEDGRTAPLRDEPLAPAE